MLDIPFPLENLPAEDAERALAQLAKQPNIVPVLLGDADIFSAEWAETVDMFEPPEQVLKEALAIDTEAWFADKAVRDEAAEAAMGKQVKAFNMAYRIVVLPVDILLFPVRLVRWPLTGRRPVFLSRSAFDPETPVMAEDAMIEMLKTQLAELEAAGEGTEEELEDIRQIIADMETEGTALFPDPVDYVTPRRGDTVAAGMVAAHEPWEVAAWLQHGTYALCAPKPVLVALCKWLWETHGGRIITASTDSIGFQMDRPIETPEEGEEVLRRFSLLGASEVNADHRGSGGSSLIGAPRLWVWWD